MPGEVVKRMHDRRRNIWENMQAVSERATEDARDLSADEQRQWDAMSGELTALDDRIKAMLDGERAAKDAQDSFDSFAKGPTEKRMEYAGGYNTNKPDTASGLGHAMIGGSTAARSAEVRKFFRGESGRVFEMSAPTDPEEQRVLSKLTAVAGANLVPTDFYNRLIAHLIEVSAVLQTNPTVLNTQGGEAIQIPKTTAHSTGAAIVSEGGTIGGTDPTFGQQTLGAFKYGVLIQVSRELLSDEGVDIEGYLAMQAGRAIGNAFGTHMVTGTGTAQPRGVVTDATLGVTGGSGVVGAFTASNLIDLHYSVIAPYRASSSCYWVVKDSTLATIRKMVDTTGQFLWQPSLQVGAPDTLLGKPLVTDPNVAGVALAAKSVIFGDFSQYFVRLAGGVRFERSDDFAFSTDLVTFRCLLRADAALVDLTGAIKFFAGNAA